MIGKSTECQSRTHEPTGDFPGTEGWQEESKEKDRPTPMDGPWGQHYKALRASTAASAPHCKVPASEPPQAEIALPISSPGLGAARARNTENRKIFPGSGSELVPGGEQHSAGTGPYAPPRGSLRHTLIDQKVTSPSPSPFPAQR